MTESSPLSVSERPHWQFKPGQSGNPGGRPKELLNAQQLARSYTTEAVEALVRGLKDPKHYVAAATALLDRAWGRPAQAISVDPREADPLSPLMHLLATRTISDAMQVELLRAEAEAVAPRPIEALSDGDLLALLPPALE